MEDVAAIRQGAVRLPARNRSQSCRSCSMVRWMQPSPERPEGTDAGDVNEKLRRHDIVQTDSDKQDRCGEKNADPRQTMTVQRLEAGRCIPLQGQIVEHAAGAEDPAVAGREYRRDDDDIDDIRCTGDAEFFKGHNKWGSHVSDLIPWIDGFKASLLIDEVFSA